MDTPQIAHQSGEALIRAAIRTCMAIAGVIEELTPPFSSQAEVNHDAVVGLIKARSDLEHQLTAELGFDATAFVRNLIAVELETQRALLRAKLGADW
ncbi:hypothetical protein [Duganella sp. S19_KUP01_CR8]|uniref:hypothetical protein n=1 Tax=Duganella sp. S19_KUP01_CR8 TaxID=3025502 RepID=UPI002FCD6BA7